MKTICFTLITTSQASGTMSIFKRQFKKANEKDAVAQNAGDTLLLHVSDMGWEMLFTGENGEGESKHIHEDCSLLKIKKPDRTEVIFGRAVKSIKRPERRRIGSIHILLSDHSTILLDDVGGELQSAGTEAIRQMAERQLNCRSASFGVAKLMGAGGEKLLYGMIDASVIRNFMHQLGDLAPKVVNITPSAELLLRQATHLNRPHCSLLMNGYNSQLMFTDMVNDCVLVRVLPIGVMSLPTAVAKHTRVNLKKAQSGLEKRDIIATLNLDDQKSDKGQNLAKGPFHDALMPLLLDLKREIEVTLRYITDQRFGQIPDKIEVFGETSKVNGLVKWLDSTLELPITSGQLNLLSLFKAQNPASTLNLLTGSQGHLVSIGKTNFSYSDGRFVEDEPAKTVQKEDVNDLNKKKGRQLGRSRSERRGKGQNKTTNERGLFGLSFLKFGSGGSTNSAQTQSQSVYYLLIGALFFGILYWAYITFYEDALRRNRNARISYEQALLANNKAIEQLRESSSKLGDLKPRPNPDADKVLWSEKMLAIAKHMDDKMWISDVYLVNESTTYNEQSVSARKLTIEGAVLPSTTGHILEIALYISRLTDDKLFMRDFSHITFEGAAIDTHETAHVVKFTLGAWYDETKVKDEEKVKNGDRPTGKLRKKINRRTDELERVRDGTNLDHVVE